MIDSINKKNYYKRLTSIISKDKSTTQIFNEFKYLSNDFEEFKDQLNNKFNYSTYDYNKLTNSERDAFLKEELNGVDILVCNNIYQSKGNVVPFKDVFSCVNNPSYKFTDKLKRKVMFPTSMSDRPVGDNAYVMWNGFQIIDLDIKDEKIANALKTRIFEDLKYYNWFLGVTLSASHKSIHVWTKIKPLTTNFIERVIEFRCNFRHKYSYIYVVLNKYTSELGYTKDNIFEYMDKAMGKPQQAAIIPYDDTSMLNSNFRDLRLDVNFETTFYNGFSSIDWMTIPELQKTFEKIEWFSEDEFNRNNDVKREDILDTGDSDWNSFKAIPKHYKHYDRWRLANTLTSLYGQEKAFEIMCYICRDTPKSELKGDIKTAATHNKPIDMWAVEELNSKHGFKIKLSNNVYKDKQKQMLDESEPEEKGPLSPQEKPLLDFNTPPNIVFNIKHNEFLSFIKDNIIDNLKSMTLLEAGAGYGKTEMIKSFKAKTLLILPFISTVKSKIEKSTVTEDWIYYYGNLKPTLDDLLSNKSMAMTIDKFSRLNIIELNLARFEYIVLDESHLLFTSSYRSVMSPTIQRLANSKSKVILMTATPTGEKLFFPKIQHIKVIKDDTRVKSLSIHFCNKKREMLIELCKSIANDIKNGKKVLFPCNDGNLYFEQVKGLIQKELNNLGHDKALTSFYYKKSNYGDTNMDNINYNKSTGNIDFIMCSNYLSVGVDIEDNSPYSVYFNKTWIAQDIEQFANRLRNKDLYVNLFLPLKDEDDIPINYYKTSGFNLDSTKEMLMLLYNIRQSLNDILLRNGDERKYNPIASSIMEGHKYIVYDENAGEYYVDETAYKLNVYEVNYMKYANQLPVLINYMKNYGYTVSMENHELVYSKNELEQVDLELSNARNIHFDKLTHDTLTCLSRITEDNIDIYREITKGNMDIIRGDKYEEVRRDNNLYTDNVEVLDKNLPIIFSLYKYYDLETIRTIYNSCKDKYDRINFNNIEKIRVFTNIVYNIKRSRLDVPIMRFIKDARRWAKEHPVTTNKDINEFLVNYSIAYGNNITGAIVDDTEFINLIHNHIKKLWKIIIQRGASRNGTVSIHPFELKWKSKEYNVNIFGTAATKEFFLQELMDNMKEEDVDEGSNEELMANYIDNNENIADNERTCKYRYSDIKDTVNDIISDEYSYPDYSSKHNLNERFMTKQKNTNSFRDTVFGNSYDDEGEMPNLWQPQNGNDSNSNSTEEVDSNLF